METEPVLPTTSQPAVGAGMELFESLLKEYENVLYLTFASSLSGTYQAAVAAADAVDTERIHIFDTKMASVIEGHYAKLALDLMSEGLSVTEIIAKLEAERGKSRILLVVDDLQHLKRGGRIGAASASIGSALKIKPILEITEDGFQSFEKIRTAKKAYKRMAEVVISEELATGSSLYLAHSFCDNGVEIVTDMFKQAYPDLTLEEHILTPVIGAHIGRNTLGIAYFKK
jgi:DegV family protein with EDD domain